MWKLEIIPREGDSHTHEDVVVEQRRYAVMSRRGLGDAYDTLVAKDRQEHEFIGALMLGAPGLKLDFLKDGIKVEGCGGTLEIDDSADTDEPYFEGDSPWEVWKLTVSQPSEAE